MIKVIKFKQANFKKIIMPLPDYGALSLTALIILVTLTFDLLTSKYVHGSILPILGFLGLSILELG